MSRFYLSNFFSLIPVIMKIQKSLNRQQKFLNSEFKELFREVRENNDGTVTPDDFYKMTRYYGYAVPAILGEGVCILRDLKMSFTERKISTCQGIITGIYDDFIDKNKLQHDDIIRITQDPKQFPSDLLINKIFVENWSYVLENVHNDTLLWKMVEKIYHIQSETLKQYDENTPFEKIKNITYKKGGYSVLFYRSIFENSLKKGEYQAFYNLGALLQFGNDIFDLRDDLRAGIYTMITKTEQFKMLVRAFYELKKETTNSFYALPYQSEKIRKFLHFIMPVINRCEVCLAQLSKIEEKYGQFSPGKLKRQEVVCDMEKKSAFIKTLKYYLTTNF